MSINAYPVFNNRMGKLTFSLSHDRKLVDFLDAEEEIFGWIHNDCGMIDLPIKTLTKAVSLHEQLAITERTLTRLQADIKKAKAHRDETVSYYCF
jgi:hypothetical protein